VNNACQRFDDLNNTHSNISDGLVIISAENCKIVHNIIEYGAANGIVSHGVKKNLLIEDNIIRYFDATCTHCSNISTGGTQNVRVLYNTVSYSGRDLVTVSGQNCEIAYNDMSHAEMLSNDGGCFYVVGNQNDKNTIVHHNWVHDCVAPFYTDARIAGIYLDNNSKGYDVYNNVIWNIPWSGIQMNLDNWNINIYNNTIVNTSEFIGRWEFHCKLKNVTVKNNFSEKANDKPGKEPTKWKNLDYKGSEYGNYVNKETIARFVVDSLNHDFRLKKGSELIDKGVTIKGFTKKYKGKALDIGAYEYRKKAWKAGITWKESDLYKINN